VLYPMYGRYVLLFCEQQNTWMCQGRGGGWTDVRSPCLHTMYLFPPDNLMKSALSACKRNAVMQQLLRYYQDYS